MVGVTDDPPLDSLTLREREALQGILDRKTAKEMGIEFGVSHHAVEKRLKRARQKLGVATSLQAARLYGERYGRTVSGAPDLPEAAAVVKNPVATGASSRVWMIGVVAMIALLLAAAISSGSFSTAAHPEAAYIDETAPAEGTYRYSNRTSVTLAPGEDLYRKAFATTDRDGSGGIVVDEFLNFSAAGDRHPAFEGYDEEARKIFAFMDSDGDGQIAFDEYATVQFVDEDGNEYLFEVSETE